MSSAGASAKAKWATISAAIVLIFATVARLTLSWVSWGSDDAGYWLLHITNIHRWGLLEAYSRDVALNHPPLALYMMRIANGAGEFFHWPATFGLRLPAITADVASAILLWRFASRRGRPIVGAGLAMLMALNLDAFLVSGHHTNTDSVYAFFVLLAGCFALDRRMFLAGLALGAAINVKLLPAILVLPLLINCRTRRELLRAISGLAIMAIPFVPLALFAFPALMRNMVNYRSQPDYWGVQLFLLDAARQPRLSAWAQPLVRSYSDFGRGVVILGVLYASLRCRRLNHSAMTAIACSAAMFLVLTPGYGLQYSVMVAPILLACAAFHGTLYGLLAGAYLFFSYLCAWDGSFPINSTGAAGLPYRGPALAFGVLAWAVLSHFLWRTLVARPERNGEGTALVHFHSKAHGSAVGNASN